MLKTYFKTHRLYASTQLALIKVLRERQPQFEVALELGLSRQRIWNILDSYKKWKATMQDQMPA